MGANRFTGEVEFTLDLVRRDPEGKQTSERKTYVFRLGTNDLIKLQDDLGMGEDDPGFIVFLSRIRSMKKLRQIMKAGLQRYQPNIDDAECGDVIDALGNEAAPTIVNALRWMFPEPQKGRGSGKADPSAGQGSSPTASEPASDPPNVMS